jgi:hypothetical protein
MNIFLLFVSITVGVIVLSVFIRLLCCKLKKTYEKYKKLDDTRREKFPLDIVYTWVESDEEFMKERDYYYNIEVDGKISNNEMKKRHVSNNELKYSLRSLEKYFPYYRHIYIVVKDGQYPKFLKNNETIKIIYHSDIILQDFLPTFNSHMIEQSIHKIPNLSEFYIYLNDDFFFLKEISPDFFINKKTFLPFMFFYKKIKHEIICKELDTYNFKNNWNCNYNFLKNFIDMKNIYGCTHIPKIYKKSTDNEIEQILLNYNDNADQFHTGADTQNLYLKTSKSKFRKNNDLMLNVLVKPNMYVYMFNSEFKYSNELYIDNYKDLKPNMSLKKYNFLCINCIDNEDIISYNKTMETLFPIKSSYEI